MRNNKKLPLYLGAGLALAGLLAGCGSGSESTTVQGDVAIAYAKRPNNTLGSSTDAIVTGSGGDVYVRERSDPSASETNITQPYTQGTGDASDLEVSYDGRKLLFAMTCSSNAVDSIGQPACDRAWRIYEYTIASRSLRKIACQSTFAGDDVDPAYLPDGRIVFASNRQVGSQARMVAQGLTPYKYHDEYEREPVTNLHVMEADGSNCRQISYNQSHDRNPTVMATGENNGRIMFSRWDHVGDRNEFTVFRINSDGTDPFVLYGAHSPGDSYLHPREMSDGRVVTTVMSLSGTRDGGSLEILDVHNYSKEVPENSDTVPPNQLGETRGQFQVSRITQSGLSNAELQAMRGRGVSRGGRYSTPYPLWDGTGRILVVWTPSQAQPGTNALGQPIEEEGTPRYGIYMVDLRNSREPMAIVARPEDGKYFADPVAIQSRPRPGIGRREVTRDASIPSGQGVLSVNTVYDTDDLGNMGAPVLTTGLGETIPADPSNDGKPNIGLMKTPGTQSFENRVARFFRISKAVPTPGGLSREAIGETEFELQQIVGYGVIEPDGSIRTRVPAETPITITALDSKGRAFTPHTNWIQTLDGERRFCKGCHSSRATTTNETGGGSLNSVRASNLANPNPATPAAGPDATATMAEARAAYEYTSAQAAGDAMATNPSLSFNLKPNLEFSDFWTQRFNLRDSRADADQSPLTISYDLLGTPPTVRGPASCRDGAGRPNPAGWDLARCSIAINFPDHIQPILNDRCAGCHGGASPSAGLDLSNTIEGVFGRNRSYQQLLIDEPVLDASGNVQTFLNEEGELRIRRVGGSAPVVAGAARASRLVERIYEEPLRASAPTGTVRSYCDVTARDSNTLAPIWSDSNATAVACVNHAATLNASEKRILVEWIDLGAQYYNDVYNSNGSLRSFASVLNQGVFNAQIFPVLQANCQTCHMPFGSGGSPNPQFSGRRYVLTGAQEGDFNATASMVTNITVPTDSLLLTRISNAPHPTIWDNTSRVYCMFRQWIAGDANPGASCPP